MGTLNWGVRIRVTDEYYTRFDVIDIKFDSEISPITSTGEYEFQSRQM